MKVATIVPVRHLEETREDDYFMALAHCAVDPDYVKFFQEQSKAGKYVIVDNSAVETGGPGDFDTYYGTAIKLGASEIMLPDIFQDPVSTSVAAASALTVYGSSFRDRGLDVMAIPQGINVQEWLENARALWAMICNLPGRPTIGISCRYTSLFGGSRLPMALYIHRELGVSSIHFLGCYKDPRVEVNPAKEFEWMSGVDSSYPSVYAHHGYELTPEILSWPRPSRDIDFLKDKYNDVLIHQNISVWREACLRGWA